MLFSLVTVLGTAHSEWWGRGDLNVNSFHTEVDVDAVEEGPQVDPSALCSAVMIGGISDSVCTTQSANSEVSPLYQTELIPASLAPRMSFSSSLQLYSRYL